MKTDDGKFVYKCHASNTPTSQNFTPVDCFVSGSLIARNEPQNHISLLTRTGETRDEAMHIVSKLIHFLSPVLAVPLMHARGDMTVPDNEGGWELPFGESCS
jgi:hypothetical protein